MQERNPENWAYYKGLEKALKPGDDLMHCREEVVTAATQTAVISACIVDREELLLTALFYSFYLNLAAWVVQVLEKGTITTVRRESFFKIRGTEL